MTRPAKGDIRRSFERAAATYDDAATVQRAVCDRLAAALPAGLAPGRILDAGCGTGYALGLLRGRHPAAEMVALDLAPAMLQRIALPCRRLAGDVEHLPLATASVDLYWSSLTAQWCDLARTLAEARRVLSPGGRLALASLGPATFHELRHAFAGVDDHRHTLSFHAAGECAQLANAAGFAAVDVHESREIAHYCDFRTLLQAVKAIGANRVGTGRRSGLLGRAAFHRAEAAFETLRTPAGLPLTYDVITLYAHA
jgi:malonyl-CoA O-methyltransferase